MGTVFDLSFHRKLFEQHTLEDIKKSYLEVKHFKIPDVSGQNCLIFSKI